MNSYYLANAANNAYGFYPRAVIFFPISIKEYLTKRSLFGL